MRREVHRRRTLAGFAAGLLAFAVAIVAFGPRDGAPAALAASRLPTENAGEAPQRDLAELMRSSLDENGTATESPTGERTPVQEAIVEHAHIAGWVDDLRDDGIAWNGTEACSQLCALPPGRLPPVEAALASFDVQQRQYAAFVLRHRSDGGSPVSPELLAVAVEALRSDLRVQLPWLEPPTATSLRFLEARAAAAVAPLRRALDSGDEQQRFLSAFVLTRAGGGGVASRVALELVRHLGDNQIGGDALMAVNGLYRLGNAALPTVREWRPFVDEQARALLDLVELDLRDPPRDLKALRARSRLHDITHVYHDPAIEYDVGRSTVAQWSR